MTTFPDVPFVDGQIFTPEVAYLAYHQQFGDSLDQSLLGNHPGITDTQLSDDTSAIKARVASVLNAFVTTIVSGLTVNVGSGVVALTDGSLVSKTSVNLTLPNNTTSFVHIDLSGVITHSTSLPVVCYPIARVVTSGGSISSVSDLRNIGIRSIVPRAASIRSFGGVNNTDIICDINTDLTSGLIHCRDFIIPSGVQVTVPGWLRLHASRNVVIDGTLLVNPLSSGGSSLAFAHIALLSQGSQRGGGLGSGGDVYGWGIQPYGSGGLSGETLTYNTSTFVRTAAGGKGGGGVSIEAAGIISGSGTISCKGSDGSAGYSYTGSPTNTTPGFLAVGTSCVIYGSSGGSGGFVGLSSLAGVNFTGTVDVRGGNGGNTVSNVDKSWAGGGYPGSGGVIAITSPNYNLTGATLRLDAGLFGSSIQVNQGATVDGSGVWTIPLAGAATIRSPSGQGASFSTLGGRWAQSIVNTNVIATPLAAVAGTLTLRNFVPLG
jgi:hypothetical protein